MSELSRHALATQDAIVEAALDLFVERRGTRFSMQEVADRAEVTHRTLYRYFPSRRDLLVEASLRLKTRFRGPMSPDVSTVADWIESAEAHFEFVERNREIFTSILSVSVTESGFAGSGESRDSRRWEVFREEFPALPQREAEEWFAMLRHLISAYSYLIYRTRFGFDPHRAAVAVNRAAEAMVETITAADATHGAPV